MNMNSPQQLDSHKKRIEHPDDDHYNPNNKIIATSGFKNSYTTKFATAK
jgi:hypothetical protein